MVSNCSVLLWWGKRQGKKKADVETKAVKAETAAQQTQRADQYVATQQVGEILNRSLSCLDSKVMSSFL
jgi:hypothetical protein